MIKKTKKQFAAATKNLKKVFFGFFMLSTLSTFGQASFDALKGTTATTASTFAKNVSVGLNVGVSNGVGIDVAYRFAKHFAVKAGYNYADYTKKGYTYDIVTTNTTTGLKETKTVSFDAGVKLSNLALNVEYMPGPKGRFKLIGGLAVFPDNTLTVGGQVLTAVKFNDVQLNPEDIGNGTIEVGFSQKVSPFIGMGFGRTFPRKRMNISFDLGTYYKGEYRVNIHVNPGVILKENEENAAVLQKNFNENPYGKFWPVMNLRLGYLIK